MANSSKKRTNNINKILICILTVLLFFTILSGAAFFYMQDYVMAEVKQQDQQVQKTNQELIEQYNQRLAEAPKVTTQEKPTTWPAASQTGFDILDLSEFELKSTRSVPVTRDELISGGLMLVNRWHPLPYDFNEEALLSIGRTHSDIPVNNYSLRLLPTALDALKAMLDGAKEAGYEHYLIEEGYRTNEQQTSYFETEEKRWNDKYVGQALIEKVRVSVNVPGTSEYQTGLSFRIKRWQSGEVEFNDVPFQESEHCKWLLDNGHKYGYTFRFPVNGYPLPTTTNQAWKTGESKKLRIFRYVGEGPATMMKLLDISLEEFIEYMIEHPHIALYEDGVLKYEFIRVQDNSTPIQNVDVVSNAVETQISTDNMGGIIISMSY